MTTTATTDEARRLAQRGRVLTRQAQRLTEQHDALIRERAQVWREAVAAGVSQRQLAAAAGLHPCQVAKALDRYASNGA